VTAVDPAALRVTISHDDIPGLMGAMTMAFPVRSADVLAGIAPGTRVRFELVRAGHDLIVTRLVALGTAAAGRPGIHDHTPHHGGVVAMVGMRHLEAVAARDGSVRVYLTDVWRRPLPLAGATGTVTVIAASPDGSTAFVGVLGTGVSAWRMPGVQFLEGFAPPPPIAVPVTEVPHPEAANAIAVSPDGAEAAVAVENRVLVYVTA